MLFSTQAPDALVSENDGVDAVIAQCEAVFQENKSVLEVCTARCWVRSVFDNRFNFQLNLYEACTHSPLLGRTVVTGSYLPSLSPLKSS